jgi:hypothetical protein
VLALAGVEAPVALDSYYQPTKPRVNVGFLILINIFDIFAIIFITEESRAQEIFFRYSQ